MEQPKNNLKIIADKKNARVILPNMLTLIGVCIGLSSIRFALDGKFEFAIIAIILAAIIDGLDGRIALAFFLSTIILKLFLGCSIFIF